MVNLKYNNKRFILILTISLVILLLLVITSLVVGNYQGINFLKLINVIIGKHEFTQTEITIIKNIRVPRTIVSILCGGALALAGALFQETFNNGLSSSDTLGISSGASVGAAVGILLGLGGIVIQLSALLFGLISITITFILSMVFKKEGKISLILSGILISGLFSSILSFIKYIADPNDTLPTIVYWLMGSVDNANYKQITIGAFPICLCVIVSIIVSWKTNYLALTDLEAKSRGINIKALRIICIVLATILTSASISMCGNIGWIGLCIPHLSRLLCGTNNKYNFPVCVILGSSFLLFVDILNRIVSTAEIPVSIFTGIIGVILFVGCRLIRRSKDGFGC